MKPHPAALVHPFTVSAAINLIFKRCVGLPEQHQGAAMPPSIVRPHQPKHEQHHHQRVNQASRSDIRCCGNWRATSIWHGFAASIRFQCRPAENYSEVRSERAAAERHRTNPAASLLAAERLKFFAFSHLEADTELVSKMIVTLRHQLMDEFPDFGRNLGCDGKALPSHSAGRTIADKDRTSDPDADWNKHKAQSADMLSSASRLAASGRGQQD